MRYFGALYAGCFGCLTGAMAQDAEIRLLESLPDHEWSAATGVSEDGQVVAGTSRRSPKLLSVPVRWTAAGVAGLSGAPVGFRGGLVGGVSADGSVIVGQALLDDALLGFAWTSKAGYQLLHGASPDTIAMADAVSADGRVVSGRTSGPFQATIWDLDTGVAERIGSLLGPSGYSSLWALDRDGDTGAGGSSSAQGVQAILWRRASGLEPLGDLPGGSFESGAAGLSPGGRVVVGNGNGPHGIEPMRWTAATGMIGLGQMTSGGFANGGADDVSEDGWRVVGGSSDIDAFIWDPIRGIQSLGAVLEREYGIDLEGWRLANVNDITADGTMMVGLAIDDATEVRRGYLVRLPAFCYADCDESTGRRVLDLSDFLEFQRRFALHDLYSDCDQNGAHDLFDFLCFQNAFAAGCP